MYWFVQYLLTVHDHCGIAHCAWVFGYIKSLPAMLLMSTLKELKEFIPQYFKQLGYTLEPKPRANTNPHTNCYELKALPIRDNRILCISNASVNKAITAILIWLENHQQQQQQPQQQTRRQIATTEELTAYLEIEFGTKIRNVHEEESRMQGQLWGAIDKMATMLEKMS